MKLTIHSSDLVELKPSSSTWFFSIPPQAHLLVSLHRIGTAPSIINTNESSSWTSLLRVDTHNPEAQN